MQLCRVLIEHRTIAFYSFFIRGNLFMSSVGGPYSGLPLGEPIHVFFWGALFMSSVGGPHSCFLLGELIQPPPTELRPKEFLIILYHGEITVYNKIDKNVLGKEDQMSPKG